VAVQDGIEEEEEEKLVVKVTNAVVDPGAVVVHLQYACLANSTVVASVRLVLSAPLAMPPLSRLLHLLQAQWSSEGTLGVPWQILPFWIVIRNLAWMCQYASYIADDDHGGQRDKGGQFHQASTLRISIQGFLEAVSPRQEWTNVLTQINRSKGTDRGHDKCHWQELDGFPEALALRRVERR
jgi:hypothetical protein